MNSNERVKIRVNEIVKDLSNELLSQGASNPSFTDEVMQHIKTLAISQIKLEDIKERLARHAQTEVWIGYEDGENPEVVPNDEVIKNGPRGAQKFIKKSKFDDLLFMAKTLRNNIETTLHADRVYVGELFDKFLKDEGLE